MTSVRRSRALCVRFEERPFLDVRALLGGSVSIARSECIVVANLLDGSEHVVTEGELRGLVSVASAPWVPAAEAMRGSGLDEAGFQDLLDRGLLLDDGADPRSVERRRREEALAAAGWDPYAAVHHLMGRWDGGSMKVELDEPEGILAYTRDWVDRAVARRGPPPPHFYERPDVLERLDLPREDSPSPFRRLLERRKTSRSFDRGRALPKEHLARILGSVFGCRGTLELHAELVALKKSSPSAGALHPVEAFPLVRAVAGVDPGLYHYNVRRHALDLLKRLEPAAVEELSERVTSGQSYLAPAHALVLLAARFERTFWKYRRHGKAYRAVLLETGHLCQTFYLACAELGLGAFVTAAVHDGDAEEALGLDRCREGVVAILGCGPVPGGRSPLEFEPRPFSPERG